MTVGQKDRTVMWVAALVCAGFALRLLFARLLPMFCDESFLLRWALGVWDGQWWLSVLEHNKKPLHLWLIAPFVRFAGYELLGGRLASILAGLVCIVLGYRVGQKLFGPPAGLVTAALICFCPYLTIYDSIVGQEPFLGVIGLALLLLTADLTARPNPARIVAIGMLIGLAVAIKETAAVFALFAVVPLFVAEKNSRARAITQSAAIGGVALLIFFTFMAYPLLALDKGMFVDDGYTSIDFDGRRIHANLMILLAALGRYWGPLYIGAAVVYLVFLSLGKTRRPWLGVTVFTAFFVGFFTLFVTGARLYPRHLMAFLPPLMPFLAHGLIRGAAALKSSTGKRIAAVALAAACLPTALLLFRLTTDPSAAGLTAIDRRQFVTGWTSGYGLDRVTRVIDEAAQKGAVIVVTPNLYGMPKDALLVTYRHSPNVRVYSSDWLFAMPVAEPPSVKELIAGRPTSVFIVVNQPAVKLEPIVKLNPTAQLRLVAERPGNASRMIVLEVPPVGSTATPQ